MKKIVAIMTILLLITVSRVFAPNIKKDIKQEFNEVLVYIANQELATFIDSLGNTETSPIVFKDPYKVVNCYGAAGRWQLTAIAREDIGYKGSLKTFLHSQQLQRESVIKLFKKNKFYLQFYMPNYQDYIGKTVNGVTVTYSGMLAAAHLAGVGGLMQFLKYGYNATDGNETVQSYMQKFSGFKIGLII